MKCTFQPSQRRRKKTHGFLQRARNKASKKILKRRQFKGRKRISI